MNEHDALLAAILAEPEDDNPRLIFADWLEEQSENRSGTERTSALNRAAFIRKQIESSREPSLSQRLLWAKKEYELSAYYMDEWIEDARDYSTSQEFNRGFIHHVGIEAVRFHHVIEPLFARFPIDSIQVHRGEEESHYVSLEEILFEPRLKQLKKLDLSKTQLRNTIECDALIESAFLADLESLSLGQNPLEVRWVEQLLARQVLLNLCELDFSDSPHLGPSLARGLTRADHRRLKSLNLSGIDIRSGDLKAILGASCLTNLESLTIQWRSYPIPGPLKELDLAWVLPWKSLLELDLTGQRIGAAGVAEIARQPAAAGLLSLNLDRNDLGPTAVDLLASSPHLNVEYLNISGNRLNDEAVSKLKSRYPNAEIVNSERSLVVG